jgi:hypothetical protein
MISPPVCSLVPIGRYRNILVVPERHRLQLAIAMQSHDHSLRNDFDVGCVLDAVHQIVGEALSAEKVQQLERSLNDPAIREEAADVLRSMIDRIELNPRSDRKGVDAVLYGDLAVILALCAATDRKGKLPRTAVPGSQLSVVAGACNRFARLFNSAPLPRRGPITAYRAKRRF